MKNKLIGVIFHSAGVVLLTLAYQEYHSVVSKLALFFKGVPPEKVLILLAGGAACTLFGLYHIFRPVKK